MKEGQDKNQSCKAASASFGGTHHRIIRSVSLRDQHRASSAMTIVHLTFCPLAVDNLSPNRLDVSTRRGDVGLGLLD